MVGRSPQLAVVPIDFDAMHARRQSLQAQVPVGDHGVGRGFPAEVPYRSGGGPTSTWACSARPPRTVFGAGTELVESN